MIDMKLGATTIQGEGMRRKPTGFIAICQCGKTVGAMDFTKTDRREAGVLLGKWIADGCTIEPRFTGSWSITVYPCSCVLDTEKD